MTDLIAHPQRRLVKVVTAAGDVELLAPGALAENSADSLGAVPSLGEHSDRIRSEFARTGAATRA
jgi:hypothetical protein